MTTLQFTKARLKSAKNRVDRYIDANLLDWGTAEWLYPVRDFFIKNGLSQRAADSVDLVKKGFMQISLVWNYRNDKGDPLHFYIEYDTKPHEIVAKGKGFGGSNYLHWKAKDGKDRWAVRVQHPGTKGKNILHLASDIYKPFLKERIIFETSHYMEIDK